MQFLFPTFLWGLLAISVPVIIHLFNFRRTKKVFFTNVAFLKNVQTKTSSFRRLKHLLVMAARMLAIACLVLAFAQPFVPAKNGQNQAGTVSSFYIDNSLSMQNELDKKSYLDRAITKLDELLSAFPQGSQLQLMSNDFAASEYGVTNPTGIRERTTGLQLSHTSRSLPIVYKRQQNLASKHSSIGGNRFFWFSDFQKSTAGDLAKLKTDSSTRLTLVPVQAQATQNVFVDSVWLSTPFIREMQTNTLSVRLFNSGSQNVENLSVKMFLDDTQVSSAVVNLGAKASGNAIFSFTVRDKGFKKGRITFDDSPITFDNDYYFVLNASPTIRVLHLFGQSSGYVQKVFANDSVFAFKSYSALNMDLGQIRSANMVIVEGVQSIDGSLKSSLDDFVVNGGSLFFIPSAKPNTPNYDAFLSRFGVRSVANLLQAKGTALSEPDRRSLFFSDIFDPSSRQEMIQMPLANAVLSWQAIGEKLLSFRNGQPFLTVSQNPKQGKVYMLASPLDDANGDYARHALFLPMLYKMAALSVRQEPLAYSFRDNSFSIDVSEISEKVSYKLKSGKTELIPVQRLIGKQLNIELPKANQLNDSQDIESGYFELSLNGKTERLLAFNHDNKESMMDFYTAEELRQLFAGQKNVEVFDKIDDADFVKTFKDQNFGLSLWKYFLIAALVFLAIEIALIRLMK